MSCDCSHQSHTTHSIKTCAARGMTLWHTAAGFLGRWSGLRLSHLCASSSFQAHCYLPSFLPSLFGSFCGHGLPCFLPPRLFPPPPEQYGGSFASIPCLSASTEISFLVSFWDSVVEDSYYMPSPSEWSTFITSHCCVNLH